jgi:Mn-dependent DtxR family transcriptional regulator
VGITEQWCSEVINTLYKDGLIESEFIAPRRINRLSERGVEIARRLKEVSENLTNQT